MHSRSTLEAKDSDTVPGSRHSMALGLLYWAILGKGLETSKRPPSPPPRPPPPLQWEISSQLSWDLVIFSNVNARQSQHLGGNRFLSLDSKSWDPTRNCDVWDSGGMHRGFLGSSSMSCPGGRQHNVGSVMIPIYFVYFSVCMLYCTLHGEEKTLWFLGYHGRSDKSPESPPTKPGSVWFPGWMTRMRPRPYLDRGCPEGPAAACLQGADHLWEESLGSPRGWLLSEGCGPRHPFLELSHLGPGRKEQKAAVSPGANQSQAPAPLRDGEEAENRLLYPPGTVQGV